MSFSRLYCILLFCALFLSEHTAARRIADTSYIREFPDQITGRIYLGEKVSIFNLEDRRLGRSLDYRPNNVLGLGLGVTIRGFGLNFSTRLPFHDAKLDKYGRTRRYDLQVHRYRGNWAFDGYAQRYKGFHLNTADDVTTVTPGTEYPYLPDLTTLNIGAAGMYIFNGQKFSMRGAVNQQDWQLRSAGSFMAGAAFFARYIYNDESIIPDYYKYPQVFDGDGIRHICNYGLTIRGGYGYNFIIRRHYFLGAAADVGAGPGYTIVRDVAGNEQNGLGLNLAANLNLSAGYNAAKWFGGVYVILHADRYAMPYDQSKVSNAQGIFRIAVARRFSTKKKALRSSTADPTQPSPHQ